MNVTLPAPSVKVALARLIDYAGLFPPAALEMPPALVEFARARAGDESWMLGRFVLPLSRVAEALPSGRDGAALPVSMIADVPADSRHWFGATQSALTEIAQLRRTATAIRIEALEVALAPRAGARETFDAPIGQLSVLLDRNGLRDLPAYVELPSEPFDRTLLEGAMTALRRAGMQAKLRCGGLTEQSVPAVETVAAFVKTAAIHNVSFKATAGLHHPVRHYDAATKRPTHGFLNILAAAAFAPRLDEPTLTQLVAEEDSGTFAFDERSLQWHSHRADIAELERMRTQAFAGYGSCSFNEPVDDLRALRLLPNPQT